jgi:hypothetical protein
VFKNAEGNVKEFAHDRGADSQGMEFSAFEQGNPRRKGLTPTPSDGGRQVKGFAQEGVADFGEASFALKIATRTILCRSQSGRSGQQASRGALLSGQLG